MSNLRIELMIRRRASRFSRVLELGSLSTRGHAFLVQNTHYPPHTCRVDSVRVLHFLLWTEEAHTPYKHPCPIIWTRCHVDAQGRLIQDWEHLTLRPIFLRYLVGVWDQSGM